jgi:hypothetical protein
MAQVADDRQAGLSSSGMKIMTLSERFPHYRRFDPSVPVWCLTPGIDGCIHRFFDTSPLSPSGRYVALTRLPSETRPPFPGETAEVVLVDLQCGETSVVASTHAVGSQLGAQAQWGPTDQELYFNDLDTQSWSPFAVRYDPANGERTDLEGPVYMVSPDGSCLASPCLLRTDLAQGGYGAAAPAERRPHNQGASANDGLYLTDSRTGRVRLLVSYADIVEATGDVFRGSDYADGAFYGFHVKWNRTGDRLMFVIRHRSHGRDVRVRTNLVTLNRDGSDIRVALSWTDWSRGGHHPDWCPDGEHILMNLVMEGRMCFVRFRFDGSDLEVLTDRPGGGHPTMHPDGVHILTDAYTGEPISFGDGSVPIRWVDTKANTEETLVRIDSRPPVTKPLNHLRLDPHPAWSRDFKRVVFNGCDGGVRRVYLMDMSGLLG